MATKWFVLAPEGESQGSLTSPVVPAGTILISISDSDPQFAVIEALNPVTINGKQYVRFMGPFDSKAAAKAAVPPSGWAAIKVLAGATISAGATAVGGGVPSVTGTGNPLSGLAAIGDFFSRLTQGATWIRVAEVLIGAALLLGALNKALGNPAGKAVTAVKGAAFL